MKKFLLSLVVIVVIIAATAFGIHQLNAHAPEAEKKEPLAAIPVVETVAAVHQDLAFPLRSEGVVMTRRESVLSAQVGGRIVEVHPQFEVGATFQEGDVIAKIDPVDYEAAVAQAKSALADAKLEVIREKARGEQSARDWAKIGGGEKATDLVKRIPFFESAEARAEAAQAMLDKSIEDLDRTLIRAPFECRVREVALNLGATVAPGTRLGMIYDPNNLKIRLPFALDDFAQIPEKSDITLFTEIAGQRHEWQAEVLWELGEVDQATLSAYLLAKIIPKEETGRFRLPSPGLFLKARLTGATLPGVVAVPRSAVRGRDEISVLNGKNELEIRHLSIARSNAETVYATEGVKDGEKVILTRIEVPVPGMKLAEPSAEPKAPAP